MHTIIRKRSSVSPALRIFMALPLLVACGASRAHPVEIGGKSIEIPTPAGLDEPMPGSPVVDMILKGSRYGGERALTVYMTAEGMAKAGSGKTYKEWQLGRLVELQVIPPMAKLYVRDDVFSHGSGPIREFVDSNIKGLHDEARQYPKLGLSNITNLGLYRKEPWGIFFSTRVTRRNQRTGHSHDEIMSGAVLSIDHRALILFDFTPVRDDLGSDRTWSQQTLSDWADAIHKANAGGFGTHATLLYKAVPWIVLFLLGLMAYFLFIKKARPR